MRMFHLAVTFDQLNVGELACFELLARRCQMAEWRHRDRLIAKQNGDELLEDEFLYMGTGETRGLLCVTPQLSQHISDELHKEATVMKEKRKLRE